MTNEQLIDDWVKFLSVNKNRSQATCHKYRVHLVWFSQFLQGSSFLSCSASDLDSFSGEHLHTHRKLKPRSRSVVVAALKNFYKWAVEQGYLSKNPASNLTYPTFGRKLPRSISLSDAETLLMAPDLNTFLGVRDAAIIAMLIGCGMRVSGLVGLNESSLLFTKDNDVERLVVRIVEKGDKERLVPVPSEAMLLLRAYLGHSELDSIDRVIGDGDNVLFVSVANHMIPPHQYHGEARRIAARSVNAMLLKYANLTGVSKSIAHPHAFRHLYGTEFFESDISPLAVQQLLGHEKTDTTKIYTQLAMRKLTEQVSKANPLGKMNTPVTKLIKHLGL